MRNIKNRTNIKVLELKIQVYRKLNCKPELQTIFEFLKEMFMVRDEYENGIQGICERCHVF